MLTSHSDVAVDVVVLSRTAASLPTYVVDGLCDQSGIDIRLHRVIGTPQESDCNRWETIARSRNEGRFRGKTPWLMFLDDDVALSPGSIGRLLRGLQDMPEYAALAADYHGASADGRPTHHVAMGATLFRRHVLDQVPFRWEPQVCECRCMCNDLRRLGWGIRYAPGVRAMHLKPPITASAPAKKKDPQPIVVSGQARIPQDARPRIDRTQAVMVDTTGQVLAALDRRHLHKFRRQFLGSLRGSGNQDIVTVVGYGWYPSELGRFANMSRVRVIGRTQNHILPPVRRLRDFQDVVRALPPESPVAYWDAADVHFQNSLQPLWQLVREHPDQLLAVREPTGYPSNPAVTAWSLSISDSVWRKRALDLLKGNPFLNSGFAAGTARVMLKYFEEADRMRHGAELTGSTDWGDQMALNLYCHLDPRRWFEIPGGWNYCAHNRPRGEVTVRTDGRIVTRSGNPIHVLHGNAHSFRKFELSNV